MAWLIALGVGSYFLDMGLYSHMMAVGFCVAGMSPDHRRSEISREDEFHTAGTAIAILSCYLGLGSLIAAAVFLAGAALLWIFARNRIWWIELLAFGVFVAGYSL